MASQIYVALSLVGGPDTRTRHWQFIPFDPFLPGGMLWVVLPHKVFLPGRHVVSFIDVYELSCIASLTFIGLFDMYVAEGSCQSDGLHRHDRRTVESTSKRLIKFVKIVF
jgi:hypothetical protein